MENATQQALVMSPTEVTEANNKTNLVIDYGQEVTAEAIKLLQEKSAKTLMNWENLKDIEPIKAAKKEIQKIRAKIPKRKKEITAKAKKFITDVKTTGDELIATLEKLEKPFDEIIEADKNRVAREQQERLQKEAARKEAIKSRITIIKEIYTDSILAYPNLSLEDLNIEKDKLISFQTVDNFNYEEFALEARAAKNEALAGVSRLAENKMIEKAAQITKQKQQKAEQDKLIADHLELAKQQQAARLKEKELAEKQAKIDADAEELRKFREAQAVPKVVESKEPALIIGKDKIAFIDSTGDAIVADFKPIIPPEPEQIAASPLVGALGMGIQKLMGALNSVNSIEKKDSPEIQHLKYIITQLPRVNPKPDNNHMHGEYDYNKGYHEGQKQMAEEILEFLEQQ